MKKILKYSLIPLFAAAMVGTASARPSLSGDSRITNELTAAAVAIAIRDNCPSITGRMTVALSKAYALRNYAVSLGYSTDEIQDFLDDKSEQSRIYGLRDQYLAQNGVSKGDSASYCTLGEAEIDKGSLLGSILKRK